MNPAKRAGRVAEARRQWEEFHWGRQSRGAPKRANVPIAPEVLVKLGSLEAVTYRTTKGREPVTHYTHEFGETGGKKPTLAMDPETKRLHIIGGGYTVTRRGIEG